MNDKVSIIVPVYNASNTLPRTLDSIISQSYSNLEIILINDGSTDNSLEICERYKKEDSRIIIVNQENKGVGEARNQGIYISGGDYISFIDADDTISKNYIYELYNSIISSGSDFSISQINCIDANEMFSPYNITSENLGQRDFIRAFLNFKIGSAVWGKLFNKKVIGDTRFELLSINEDFIFLWEVLKKSKLISMIPQASYNYYLNTNNSLTKIKFTTENMSMVVHIDRVLNDVRNMYTDLIGDAKNYYGACLLHNLIIYYKYLCSDDCNKLFLREFDIMLERSKRIDKISNYFLISERGNDIEELIINIKNKLMNRR